MNNSTTIENIEKKVETHLTIPTTLRKNGFTYVLHRRGNQSFIYEQRVRKKTIAYEVFVHQITPAKNILGKILPSKEKFPANEDFGLTAWTYRTLEQAMKKFNDLEKR